MQLYGAGGIVAPTAGLGLLGVSWRQLPDKIITRPNNVTAYAANQIYGAGGDARIELTGLGEPGDWVVMRGKMILKTNVNTLALRIYYFDGPPTQLGDQAVADMTDADLAKARADSGFAFISAGSSSVVFSTVNTGAGAAGRQTGFLQTPNSAFQLTANGLWLYLVAHAAHVPLALQEMVLQIQVARVY